MNDPPESNSYSVADTSLMKPQTTMVEEKTQSIRPADSHNFTTSGTRNNDDHNNSSSQTEGIHDKDKISSAVNGNNSVKIDDASSITLKGQENEDPRGRREPITTPLLTDSRSSTGASSGDETGIISTSPKSGKKTKATENQNARELSHATSWEQAQPAWKKVFPSMIQRPSINTPRDHEMSPDRQITIRTTPPKSTDNQNGPFCTAYRSTVHQVTNVLEAIETPRRVTRIESSYEIYVIPLDLSSLSTEQDNSKKPPSKTRYRDPPRRNAAARTRENSRARSIGDFSSTESTSADEPKRLYARRGRRSNKTIGMVVEPATMRHNRNRNSSYSSTSVKTEDKGVQVGGGEEKSSMVSSPELPSQPIPTVITHLPHSPPRSVNHTTDQSSPRQPTTPVIVSPKTLSVSTSSPDAKGVHQNVRQVPQSPRTVRTPPHLRTVRPMNSFSSDKSQPLSPNKTKDERLADGIARSHQVLKDLFKTQNEALSRRHSEEKKKAARESAEGKESIDGVKIDGKGQVALNDKEVALNDARSYVVAEKANESVLSEVMAGSAHGAFARVPQDAFGPSSASSKDDSPAQHASDTSLGHKDATHCPPPVEIDACLAQNAIPTPNAIVTDGNKAYNTGNSGGIAASWGSKYEKQHEQNVETKQSPPKSAFQRSVVEKIPSQSPGRNVGNDDAGNEKRTVNDVIDNGTCIADRVECDSRAPLQSTLEDIPENNDTTDTAMKDHNERNRQGADVTNDQSSAKHVVADGSQEGDQRLMDDNAAVRKDFKRYDPQTEEFRPRHIEHNATVGDETDNSDELTDQEDYSSRIVELKPLDLGTFDIPVPPRNQWLRDPTQCMLRFGSAIGIPAEQRYLHKYDENTGEIIGSTAIDVHG